MAYRDARTFVICWEQIRIVAAMRDDYVSGELNSHVMFKHGCIWGDNNSADRAYGPFFAVEILLLLVPTQAHGNLEQGFN